MAARPAPLSHAANCALRSLIDGTQPPATTCLERHFGAQPDQVSAALVELVEALRIRAVPQPALDNLQMVLAEALNNISEHAYGARKDGHISVEVFVCTACVCCRITDSGREMPGLRIPEGRLPTRPASLADMPEGGFGWFLIHQMTSDLEYQRGDGTNTLRFQLLFDA